MPKMSKTCKNNYKNHISVNATLCHFYHHQEVLTKVQPSLTPKIYGRSCIFNRPPSSKQQKVPCRQIHNIVNG